MQTPVVQRWRDRRGSYRPAGETICTRDYEVTPIATALARPVVLHLGQALPYPKFAVGERGGGASAAGGGAAGLSGLELS